VGASVYIDRKDIGAIGRTPFTGHLKPGKHTIYVERQGYAPLEKTIDVKPGTATQYEWPMEKTKTGWINVAGREARGARLVVDGKPTCAAPCRAEVPPGRRRAVIEKRDREDYGAAREGAHTPERPLDTQSRARPPLTRAISTAVTAAVILAGGVYVGHLAQQNEDAIRADIK